MYWPVICITLLQTVIIRLTSRVTKAGQMVRSGTVNKTKFEGNSLIKFNLLLLLRPGISKNMKSYLQLNTNTKVSIIKGDILDTDHSFGDLE